MNGKARQKVPEVAIDLLEPGESPRIGHLGFPMERIRFSTAALESYAFADWESVVCDALVVAAAAEYADRVVRRPGQGWCRRFKIRIPVHDLSRWQATETVGALVDALEFLTGDEWLFEFSYRSEAPAPIRNSELDLAPNTQAVIAYSDGMDSRAVAGLLGREMGDRLVKVRLHALTPRLRRGRARVLPFAGVPYELAVCGQNKDSMARNRGFKFSSIAGIAAYLAGANEIVVPESGQGALGPVLVGVAHAYPDYRNHPLFARKMELYLYLLFGRHIRFRFPRLWHTKGETLLAYASLPYGGDWSETRSCWRSSRWVSVNGSRRQCGVCAACMLRRMSVHAAGLDEVPETYATPDLAAPTLEAAVDPAFRHANDAFVEYAHAGFLHLDHLADMAEDAARQEVRAHAAPLAVAFDMTIDKIEIRLRGLLEKHRAEWEAYMRSLGAGSFLAARRSAGR